MEQVAQTTKRIEMNGKTSPNLGPNPFPPCRLNGVGFNRDLRRAGGDPRSAASFIQIITSPYTEVYLQNDR